MAKLFLAATVVAIVCFSCFADAHHGGRHDHKGKKGERCKSEGAEPSHHFRTSSVCKKENSQLTLDRRNGRKKPAKFEDEGVDCKCYEAGWLRCKGSQQPATHFTATSASSPSGTTQQGVRYEANRQCYDGNSENRSKHCKIKVVVLAEGQCKCHEPGWRRCEGEKSLSTNHIVVTTTPGQTTSTSSNPGTVATGAGG